MSKLYGKSLAELVAKGKKEFSAEVQAALSQTDVSQNGAELEHAQIAEYVTNVRGESRFLNEFCRYETVPELAGKIGRIHIGQPLTQAASSGDDNSETGKASLDALPYDCVKIRLRHVTDMDALYTAAGGRDSLESALFAAIQKRSAIDQELLAFNGNTSQFATVQTPMGKLLRAANGWNKLAERGRVLDAGGSYLSEDVLEAALDMFPDDSDTGDSVRWIGPRALYRDWKRLCRQKGYDLSGPAYIGKPFRVEDGDVFGHPFIPVGSMFRSEPITSLAATPGQAISATQGPWQISATNNKMRITLDGGAAVDVTFSTGLQSASDLAQAINAATNRAVARDWDGRLLVTSTTTGASSSVLFSSISNSIYLTLTPSGESGGIAAGTTSTGADAGDGGTVHEGARILLTDPKNLIFCFADNMRITTRYDDNTDAIRMSIFAHVTMLIENPDACVLVKNVRKLRQA